MASAATTKKIVLLGDHHVGKSAMAFCYWLGKWPQAEDDDPMNLDTMNFDRYIPKVGSEEQLSREMPDTHRQLWLVDTSGGEEQHRLTSLHYPQADAFIIAYAVDRCVGVLNMDHTVYTLSRALWAL